MLYTFCKPKVLPRGEEDDYVDSETRPGLKIMPLLLSLLQECEMSHGGQTHVAQTRRGDHKAFWTEQRGRRHCTYVAVMRDCGVDSAEERLQTVQKADDDDDVYDERETLV